MNSMQPVAWWYCSGEHCSSGTPVAAWWAQGRGGAPSYMDWDVHT
jgi:hypothetical protein